MSLPTINHQIIETTKTALIFAAIVFIAGFYTGNHYAHTSAVSNQKAIQTAVRASLVKD